MQQMGDMTTHENMKITDEQNKIILEDVQRLLPNYDEFVEDVLEQFMNENEEVPKMFSWADGYKTGTEERSNPKFKKHAKAIGTVLSQCLVDLRGIGKYEQAINQLADKHNKKNVQSYHYEKLGGCILQNIEKRLGPTVWDEERKQAWVAAYNLIIFNMMFGFWLRKCPSDK
ncbi:uncharacterized protein LOC142335448 [Convolutriloba macropyga]|uniref:uncharacterized protein LOC142335448 n=1 Tax=Convolutriloba macropyga TaxID=536237 RepID=UPI003F51B638